jgi:hypothetical protein
MAKIEVHKLTNSNFLSMGSKPIEYLSISNADVADAEVSIVFDNAAQEGGTAISSSGIFLIKNVVIPPKATLVFENEEFLVFPFKRTVDVSTVAAPNTLLTGKAFLIKKTGGSVDLLIKKGNLTS